MSSLVSQCYFRAF